MSDASVTAPVPLRADHIVCDFSCQTHEALDQWLRERALIERGAVGAHLCDLRGR